jgi:hypothetical protein
MILPFDETPKELVTFLQEIIALKRIYQAATAAAAAAQKRLMVG